MWLNHLQTGHAGRTVQVCGLYGVQDLGGYAVKVNTADGGWKKVRRTACIRLTDGSFIDLKNRPEEEMNALDGCRVTATGKLIIPAYPPAKPIMARPDALPSLDEIASVQLQPGELGA